MLKNKQALNTDLEMMGVTAMLRLYGQQSGGG